MLRVKLRVQQRLASSMPLPKCRVQSIKNWITSQIAPERARTKGTEEVAVATQGNGSGGGDCAKDDVVQCLNQRSTFSVASTNSGCDPPYECKTWVSYPCFGPSERIFWNGFVQWLQLHTNDGLVDPEPIDSIISLRRKVVASLEQQQQQQQPTHFQTRRGFPKLTMRNKAIGTFLLHLR